MEPTDYYASQINAVNLSVRQSQCSTVGDQTFAGARLL